jgi:Ca2+:H+ antiporter
VRAVRPALLGAPFVVSAIAGFLHFADANAVVRFVVSALALSGLAYVVGAATESVGARFGPAVTGVLQSTLGNLPELFIVLFALAAGEVVVATTAVLGSLFANALLVLGLAIIAGSWRASDGIMRFNPRLPNDAATLLLLSVFIIVLVGISHEVEDPASGHTVAISAFSAVALLSVYAVWLWGYLRTGGSEPALEHVPEAPLAFPVAVGLLAAAIETLGISKAFTGIVIVAIAGNAVENVVGISLAAKGQNDLAISVIKNSVAQIAAFLFPALVLLSLFLEHRLTFLIGPVAIGALALMALSVWQITGDGEAAAFEGWALVALYFILAVIAWYE